MIAEHNELLERLDKMGEAIADLNVKLGAIADILRDIASDTHSLTQMEF